jgi:putative two-component system response regulator
MKKERCEHFDPDVLDIFMENVEEILTIRGEVNQGNEQAPAEFRWSERDQALDRR